jgi:hypothetical protein
MTVHSGSLHSSTANYCNMSVHCLCYFAFLHSTAAHYSNPLQSMLYLGSSIAKLQSIAPQAVECRAVLKSLCHSSLLFTYQHPLLFSAKKYMDSSLLLTWHYRPYNRVQQYSRVVQNNIWIHCYSMQSSTEDLLSHLSVTYSIMEAIHQFIV